MLNEKNKEQLIYLLDYTRYCIEDLVNKVLDDSESEPEYSAVTASNLIKCYIDVITAMETDIPYTDAESYLTYMGYSQEEVKLLEEKRLKEQPYYKGKIY